jgi:hypothetical protein
MRRLAEDFEPDPIEAWTWVHLAQLCGTDLTRMEAIYEDGSPADDDLPGNIFAIGGIDVPDISAEQQAHRSRKRHAGTRPSEPPSDSHWPTNQAVCGHWRHPARRRARVVTSPLRADRRQPALMVIKNQLIAHPERQIASNVLGP